MIRLLHNFELDRLSFWLGFLAASLLWWFLIKFRPFLAQMWEEAKKRIRAARGEGMPRRTAEDLPC